MTIDDVPPADPRVHAVLGAEGFGDLFHPHQHRACVLVDRYALALACQIARDLALPEALTGPHDVADLARSLGFAAPFLPPLRWLLAFLADAGWLASTPAGFRQRAPLPDLDPAAVRAAGIAHDAAYEPAYALLAEAAALYPRVARGEVVAERALFLRVRLWQAYFSNANPYYAQGNRIAAHAAAAALERTTGGPVLEIGAGLGSATEALFELLADGGPSAGRLADYVLSEPVPFFRRRAEQVLGARWPALPITSMGLDLNQPWATQLTAPAGGFALVWGVNVFHLARDLDAALAAACDVLRPGGWIVAGEGMRPRPGRPVAAELPFQLLESFTAVSLDPARRRTPGFLSATEWRLAFDRAGLEAVHLVPDVSRVQALAPVFLGAAVCGRRPAR